MRWSCFHQLKSYDVDSLLKSKYNDYLLDTPEQQFDVTLKFDLNNLPSDTDDLLKEIGQLKRNALAAPFILAFKNQIAGQVNNPPMVVNYREGEAIYVHSQTDRVTVIFTITFKEEMDRVFGKVFLQVSSSIFFI
jgi:actin related protein 2/3 complex subunit 2